jgi:hypothetical protein
LEVEDEYRGEPDPGALDPDDDAEPDESPTMPAAPRPPVPKAPASAIPPRPRKKGRKR